MRWIGWLLAVLLGGLWAASELPPTQPVAISSVPPPLPRSDSVGSMSPRVPQRAPALHPWVVASEQALLSLLALAALQKGPTSRSLRPD